MNEKRMRDKVKGALYGVAVGDALGGPVEFLTAPNISKQYGWLDKMVGGGWLHLKPGEITDDTEMTLQVARGIVEACRGWNQICRPINDEIIKRLYECIGREFIKWYQSGPKDVGGTCAKSIFYANQRIEKGMDAGEAWNESAKQVHRALGGRSAGNGALMRTIYPALYFRDMHTAVKVAKLQSSMTHYDDLSASCCGMYTTTVWTCLHLDPQECRNRIRQTLGAYEASGFLPSGELRTDGFVLNAFKIAFTMAARNDNFKDMVENAVNLGGDADTNGAIAGGLAGAIFGYKAIPQEWIGALAPEIRDELDVLVEAAVKDRRI